jgi:hypothetical protein
MSAVDFPGSSEDAIGTDAWLVEKSPVTAGSN